MDLEQTRTIILGKIRSIAGTSGRRCPGQRQFKKLTGIQEGEWEGKIWTLWSDALKEAGCEGNIFNPSLPPDHLFTCLAKLTIAKRRLRTHAHLNYAHHHDPNFPDSRTFQRFQRQLGGRDELVNSLVSWVQDKPEYRDVAEILSSETTTHSTKSPKPKKEQAEGIPPTILSDSWNPPVIECLPKMAVADPDLLRQCHDRGLDENVEFEKRIAIAFKLLGFSVEELGQGAGRVADGIAECRQFGWAVVYDAKVRRNGYSMGTEDRKFKEYIESHTKRLKSKGISKIYFAVVSSFFATGDLAKAREITRLTEAKSFVFLEAGALVKLVEGKLRVPLDFTDIERIFVDTRIVTDREIDF